MDNKQNSERREAYCQKTFRRVIILSLIFTLIMLQVVLTFVKTFAVDEAIKKDHPLPMKTTTRIVNRIGRKSTNIDDNSTRQNYQNLTMVGKRNFFIYSAVVKQLPPASGRASIVFNGWEHVGANFATYMCCLHFANRTVTSEASSKRPPWRNNHDLIAQQIVCNITNMVQPDLAGLVLANESCTTDAIFRQVVYRKRQQKPKFAICAKIAYGNKNPKELIEWMEYHLHFGVDAVVIYPYYDLNPDAMKVLNYYANRKQLEMVPLPRGPLSDTHMRNLSIASKGQNNDEQVPNYDAQERLQGYKYYTIMDTDEFIVPGKNITSFVQLMEYLTKKHKNAGTFRMLTEVHLLDWNKTNTNTDIKIAQYGYHTKPRDLATKFLHVTDRIKPGTVWIHGAKTIKGFIRYTPDPSDVVLKHFRYCKDRWFRNQKDYKPPCVQHFEKVRGHFMDNIAKLIAPRILKVKHILQLD